MKQRVCVAIGMLLGPKVIIADEPTSALDVISQRLVMETLGREQQRSNAALVLIGHDIGLMAQFVHRLAVMYAGRLVEIGTIREVLTRPRHPYTRALIASIPRLRDRGRLGGIQGVTPSLRQLPRGCAFHPRCPSQLRALPARQAAARRRSGRPPRRLPSAGCGVTAPLIELAGAGKRFGAVTALQPISLGIEQDNAPILAVAGESGSGKTTLASLLLGFVAPSEGEIRFRGENIAQTAGRQAPPLPARGAGRLPGPVCRLQPVLSGGSRAGRTAAPARSRAFTPPGARDDGSRMRARRPASAGHTRPLPASSFPADSASA